MSQNQGSVFFLELQGPLTQLPTGEAEEGGSSRSPSKGLHSHRSHPAHHGTLMYQGSESKLTRMRRSPVPGLLQSALQACGAAAVIAPFQG